jgi:hypothetical protein
MTGLLRRHRPSPAGVASLLAAMLALAPRANAAWTDFLPTPFEKHAWIETFASYERDDSKGDASAVRWSDTFFRERLRLESAGFSYDPRFLLYQLSIAGSGKQELYDSSAYDSSKWEIDGAIEYDLRMLLLPEHAYNFEVFASRHEPVYRQQAATSRDTVMERQGATLRYERKPWFLTSTFVNTAIDSAGSSSDVQNLNVNGEWFKRFVSGNEISVNGAFTPSWYSDSEGLDGSSMEYLANNIINLRKVRLSSNVSQNTFDQSQGDDDRYDTDQFAAWEMLSLYLPWGFTTAATYRHSDHESGVDSGDTSPERRFTNAGDRVQVEMIHRLYDSLDTRYRFGQENRDSTNGSSDRMSNGLFLDYVKKIPHGRVLAGASLNRYDLTNTGFADVVSDPYSSTPVPGTFALRQDNVDRSSIIVAMRSPLPPFENIVLVEGLHYQVNTALEPFEIQLLTLPPEFVVPGSYDLYVSFSMQTGDYELRTDSAGTALSIELLDGKVTPYFRYMVQRSDVLSGSYPGAPMDSDSYTTGLRLVYGPLRARGEYQVMEWDINPWRAGRAELQYTGTITRTITAYSTLTYLNRHYLGGDPPYSTLDFTEEVVTVSGNLTKQIWSNSLFVTVGGSYSHMTGISDSDAWSANSSLIWHVGKLDIALTASAFGSESTTGFNPSVEREHELISLNIRRQLL